MRSVLGTLFIAFFLYFIGIATGEAGLFLIGVSGVFFSIIFPTLILSYGMYFKDATRATSLIVAGASGVNMLSNSAMGVLNDMVGISNAMYFIPFCLSISIVLMLFIKRKYGFEL